MSKTLSLGKALYCNLHKGPQHNNQCENPTQCYCHCHTPAAMTIHKLNQEITYHKNSIDRLNKSLQEKSKYL